MEIPLASVRTNRLVKMMMIVTTDYSVVAMRHVRRELVYQAKAHVQIWKHVPKIQIRVFHHQNVLKTLTAMMSFFVMVKSYVLIILVLVAIRHAQGCVTSLLIPA
jgi:hypothetical protein